MPLVKVKRFAQDWARKFGEALGSVRKSAKRAGITSKWIDDAVKTARRGRHS